MSEQEKSMIEKIAASFEKMNPKQQERLCYVIDGIEMAIDDETAEDAREEAKHAEHAERNSL